MKSLKTLILTGIAAGITLLFSQCHNGDQSGHIPYNKDNARLHYISLYDASQLTANFKIGKLALERQLKDSAYLNRNFSLPLAEEFNRDAIAELLDQKGAKGMRIYLGESKDGLIRLVLVAVDDQHNDITGAGGGNGKIMKFVSNTDDGSGGGSGVILEAGQRCPTLCSTNSDLNK